MVVSDPAQRPRRQRPRRPRRKCTGILEPPSWLTTTLSKRPLWIAIQSYQQPRKDARFPTPAEYRCMAYLSIINGVKGLWFYTGSGQKDWQGKPAGLLNKPEEAHWDYVQKLVRELRTLSPVIMAPACAAKLSISPADAPVEYTLREAEGMLYLLAANKSVRPQTVKFSGGALDRQTRASPLRSPPRRRAGRFIVRRFHSPRRARL